jgi:hypothetical protein
MFRRLAQSVVRTTQYRFASHDYQVLVNAKKCVVFMKGTPDAPQVLLINRNGFKTFSLVRLFASGHPNA